MAVLNAYEKFHDAVLGAMTSEWNLKKRLADIYHQDLEDVIAEGLPPGIAERLDALHRGMAKPATMSESQAVKWLDHILALFMDISELHHKMGGH